MNYIDRFLNSITMYQLVLRSLQVLVAVSLVLSAFGILSYSVLGLIESFFILTFVAYFSNVLFAKLYRVQANVESTSITAFILFLVLAPPVSFAEAGVIALTGFIAVASKYIFNIRGRHIFNPAAIALVLIGVFGSGQAIWWVGSEVLLPFTLIAGFLIVRKIRRFPLFLSFFIVALIEIVALGIHHGGTFSAVSLQAFTSWPLIFFGTIMLTEPATMPSSRNLQIVFGVIVGLLFGSQWNIGPLFATSEFALCAGNLFAFLSSSRPKLRLYLKEKKQLAQNIMEFSFTYQNAAAQQFAFLPGQYMEWTFAHAKPDSRGNRRYFTIASSPTEQEVKLGIRVQDSGSSTFKSALSDMKIGDEVLASSLAGDFVLPTDAKIKLGFIGGGIGITPFRSMIKYMSDKKLKRDVVMFYAATLPEQFAYKDVFKEAKSIGVKTLYVISSEQNAPADWQGLKGAVTKEVLQTQVPDFQERHWYISGPNAMVESYKDILVSLDIPTTKIKKDYFPGF